jgi:DNA polymerase III subunit alpha
MGPVYPQIRTSADILKSTIRIEQLIPFLKEQKAEAGALVNSKLYGLLPFVTAMKKANIHPVIGLIIEVEFEGANKLPVILYAKSNEGYQNLLKVSSAASITQHEVIPMRWLQSYAKGLIAVIPAYADQFSWLEPNALPFLEVMQSSFQEHLYIGLERKPNSSIEMEQQVIMLSEHLRCQIVALHENVYMQEEDYFAYEVATAIDRGVKLHETVQLNKKKDHYLLTADQWNQLYADVPQYLQATKDMLLSCQVDLDVSIVHMPKYPLIEGETAELRLKQHVHSGLKERLGESIPTAYIERAKYELNVINTMGYADYFLIVEDFMRYARTQNIVTGPGRGSSASSLVAYALQITQVDPLAYDLLFERFLNPERVSLPDIDIDFLDTRRDEVIAYVAQKYGKQHVAQIITFGTLSAKAVGRDVARMFNFDSATLEMISKLIPNKMGITLTEAYNSSDKLREWVEAEDIRKRWYQTALKLEGLPRNASTHAAGVVLSPVPLVDVVPIQEGHDGVYLTQWPMQEVEQSGLLKMDFLGLRNLTILDLICKSIAGSHQVQIDLNRIPLDDAKTFELLRQGDTTGIFQLESDGMRQALREIKPTQFSDIVAVNALYRPGPMDFIPVYARRKHHQEPVVMPHEHLAPILNETYGIIVYQEQIMRIANVLAGFSIGEADLLRRAVSKKKREVLEEQREKFVRGAQKKGYDVHVANEVYELIVRFADYGFAKSHAVAYSMISYQLAYLKANFPVNFYAALMTNASGNQEKLVSILHEAKSKQIEILPPSIYKSGRYFKVEQNKIRFSLSAIKGVPQPVLKQLGTLNYDEIHSIFDLAVAMKGNAFNRKNMEPLIKAGALDDFQKDRATLLATLDAAVKQAELVTQFADEDDLFGNNPYAFGRPKHIEASPIPLKEKLMFEKEVLGFYLSDHPIQLIRRQLPMHTLSSAALSTIQDGTFVAVIGQVEEARVIRTKKGEQMAFVTLTDEFGQIAITLFPKIFTGVKPFIQQEAIVYIEGKLERRFGKIQIIANSLKGL